ncbi:MAG: FKBP-type peptidyl-prolyl cis-trans isomerase [Proteobacteria bacterium]|nr:FKBP-type peptidyl-prolyl cis-trans isomerase [Pseudomonadota bacterium]
MPAEDVWETTESGLAYADLVEGTGDAPAKHAVVTVEYTGWLESGKVLDSSYKRPESFEFVLGVGSVVPGWDEGLATMRPGGKRLLRLPPELHYGPGGRPPRVPPNHVLLFEIELVEVGPLRIPPDAPPEVSEWQSLPTGLQYAVLATGSGDPVKKGQTAKMEYSGWLEDGKLFDSSYNSPKTLDFKIGGRRVIQAWDQGVEGMRVGERRMLRVSPELGYGDRGFPPVIPPNATLLFEVELTGVE